MKYKILMHPNPYVFKVEAKNEKAAIREAKKIWEERANGTEDTEDEAPKVAWEVVGKDKWVHVGNCAVDSGQIILVDPCYVLPEKKNKDKGYDYSKLTKRWEKGDWKEKSFEEVFSGVAGTGVAVRTGYGDGCYPVYIRTIKDKDWGERVAEVKVKFI